MISGETAAISEKRHSDREEYASMISSSQDRAEMGRERLFSDAAKGGYWVAAAHITSPGLHVGARNGTFFWIPGDYTTRMSVDPVTGQPK